MRIIAGRFGGLRLKAPVPNSARPTSDRVREALFSVLASRMDLEDATVLDLFAGTGALGLEAISRGASALLSVEMDNRAVNAIQKNAATMGVSDTVRTLRTDVAKLSTEAIQRAAQHDHPMDLILLDPPYAIAQVAADFLSREARAPLVHEDTLIVLEHGTGKAPVLPENLALVRSYRYGDTTIVLLAPIA